MSKRSRWDQSKVHIDFCEGFHYYRKELDEMEDPEEAHAKRGAHWTFNASEFVNAVRQLRNQGEIFAPIGLSQFKV